jgi:hypothetical protein
VGTSSTVLPWFTIHSVLRVGRWARSVEAEIRARQTSRIGEGKGPSLEAKSKLLILLVGAIGFEPMTSTV